jgi:Flp pilus assembly protein TadG
VRQVRSDRRRGVAAVELAILLPFLAFVFVVAVDWCRIFYFTVTLDNCARNGALNAFDSYALARSPYSSSSAAALADAANLSPPPTVTTSSGVDGYGQAYAECTVTYTYETLTNFPGVPRDTVITRTVRVYKAPQVPN